MAALLFYFGYVATRSRYDYFGVDLTLVDLSSRQLILAGLEVVFVAALYLCFGIILVVGVHTAALWLITSKPGQIAWGIVGLWAVAGILLAGRGLVGAVVPEVAANEDPPGQTRLALALGPALVAYSAWLALRLVDNANADNDEPTASARWLASPPIRRLRRVGAITAVSLFVVGAFSATHSLAWTFGAGRAYDNAVHLHERPEVVLEVEDRLPALPPGVTELPLSGDAGKYRYRYRGLRLLVAAGGKLFLVPAPWTSEGMTLIVPYDGSVRIQLIPQSKVDKNGER